MDMSKRIIITGGAGFLGSNLAIALHNQGEKVWVIDNISRPGSRRNSEWLREQEVHVTHSDINFMLEGVYEYHPDIIIHLAGQVAVTDSVADPLNDFYQNAQTTFKLLHTAARIFPRPLFVYSSTNKVYGPDTGFSISEGFPLHMKDSPYACSKGTADLYCQLFSNLYDLPTIVLRQSCIYGTRQWALPGQGWIAWFAKQILAGEPITFYGSGEQVRDVLYVSDWVSAIQSLIHRFGVKHGTRVYNLGGGPDNRLCLKGAVQIIQEQVGREVEVRYEPQREGDQRYYVSDIRQITEDLGWKPLVRPVFGIEKQIAWMRKSGQ